MIKDAVKTKDIFLSGGEAKLRNKTIEQASEEWYAKLSEKEKQAVFDYTSGYNTNASYLRDTLDVEGWSKEAIDELKKEYARDVKILDGALDKYELDKDIKVYRTVNADFYKSYGISIDDLYSNPKYWPETKGAGKLYLDMLEGHVEKGYMSTSFSLDETFRLNTQAHTLFEIDIPAGAKGAYLGDNSALAAQKEFLLSRNTKLEIKEAFYENIKYIDDDGIQQERLVLKVRAKVVVDRPVVRVDKVDKTMMEIDKEQAILKKKLLEITKKIDANSMNDLTSRERNKLMVEKAQAINNGILAAEKVYDLYFAEAHTQAKIVADLTDRIVESMFHETATEYKGRKMYDIAKETRKTPINIEVNKDLVKKTLDEKHFGTNMSEKIWKTKEDSIKIIREKIIDGMENNASNPRTVAREINKVIDMERWKIERVVRTEMATIQTKLDKESYESFGFDKFQFLATFDNRTSEICRSLDAQTFDTSVMESGVNAPPMHPNCRSTTIAYFDGNFYKRAGRNIETGKWEDMDDDIKTFADYERKYL